MRKARLPSRSYATALVAGLLLLSITGPLMADTIYLRSGRAYYGKILNQTATEVLIKTNSGVRTVAKRDIQRITYEAYDQAVEKERRERAARLARARARAEEKRKREAKEREERDRKEALAAKLAFRKEQALARKERTAFLRKQVEEGKIKKEDINEPIGFWDFAWRSMVVPGWGHVHMERPIIGSAYFAGFVLFAARAYTTRQAALEAQAANNRETANNTILFATANQTTPEVRYALAAEANRRFLTVYQSKLDQANGALLALGLFYAFQALHIVADGLTWEDGGLFGTRATDHEDHETVGPRFALAILPEIAEERGRSGSGAAPGASPKTHGLRAHWAITIKF